MVLIDGWKCLEPLSCMKMVSSHYPQLVAALDSTLVRRSKT